MKKIALFLVLALFAGTASATEFFPKPNWKEKPDPLASPDAIPGGELSTFAGQYPKSLNYYLDNNSFVSQLFDSMFETLLSKNPVTLENEPAVAKRWSISDDHKKFTFYLDEKARWSDNTRISAHDVKWTYDIVTKPDSLTGVHKVSLERFYPPEVIDDYTIAFTAKSVHWKNLLSVGTFHIMPKAAYGKKDFNKINFEFPVVSGPYILDKINEGMFITLRKRADWWRADALSSMGTNNFDTLKFRFFADRNNAFEAFKKGMIDIFPIYTSRVWMKETSGEKFQKNQIVKQKVYNHHPIGFQGFAMNMRKPPFDDARLRKAMAYLLDRKKMNATLMYNQYFLHKSYFEDLYSKAVPCPNPPISMNKDRARALLKEAGWVINPSTGLLEKNGKPLTVSFLTRSSTTDKFLAIYAEDLRDVGIQLKTDKKDWAAWARDMDEFNFEMTWAAWGATIFKDPEGMWSSREADRIGGNNITGFKSETVDRLIEEQKGIFDVAKRNEIARKIDAMVYNEFPYVLLWNIKPVRLLYWNKFGTPDTVLSKYGTESSAYPYWWVDPDSEADLADALENNNTLPAHPGTVDFDEAFGH